MHSNAAEDYQEASCTGKILDEGVVILLLETGIWLA
jgi:hypothetical protein